MTGASAALRASVTGECPAQRIHDSKAGRVRDIVHRSVITEHGTAECHRCGRTVRVTRKFDDGRWGWSPWRYDTHKPSVQEPEHANGDPCPTCDVDENAPNPSCASWVHPGNGPSQDHADVGVPMPETKAQIRARKVTPQTVTLTAHEWLIIMGALGLRGDVDPRTLPIRHSIYRQTQDHVDGDEA